MSSQWALNKCSLLFLISQYFSASFPEPLIHRKVSLTSGGESDDESNQGSPVEAYYRAVFSYDENEWEKLYSLPKFNLSTEKTEKLDQEEF